MIYLGNYTLDKNNNPIECSLKEWGELYSTPEGKKRRRVGNENFKGLHISTVFLGIDHGLGDHDKPVLFETMVFDEAGHDIYQTRCCTWEEAEEMHKKAIDWVKNGCKEED